MRNKFLTTLLSLLMLFNTLPVNTVNTVIAEGEDENVIVETTPAEEETAQEDEYVVEEETPADTGEEVLPAEETPADEGGESVDFVKTEDDDIFAVTIHGDAAEDPEAAAAALSEHTDLSLGEIEEIMAVTFDDGTNNASPQSEADGTKIIGITAKWITQDTVDNGDESLLYVKPADTSDQSVKLQINYSLAGEYDYEPGDVEIKIPASIFKGRAPEYDDLGNVVLPFLEAPDSSSDFNWQLIKDEETGEEYYLLTNTRKMEAATKGHIRLAFTGLSPVDLVDMKVSEPFTAEIFVRVHTGKLISLKSNTITAQFDTEARVVPGSASKTAREIKIVDANSIPKAQRIEGEQAYVIVRYYTIATIEANTRYTLTVKDYIPDQLGGFILKATSEDGRELEEVVYEGTRSGKTVNYWYTVAYPVSAFTPDQEVILKNSVEFKVTEVDPEADVSNPNVQDPDPQLVTTDTAVCTPRYTYRLPKWVDPDGHYMIWKNGNDGKAKRNVTRSVDAINTDYTRSDYLLEKNGYYGIYPSALNDLQDGKNVDLSYTINSLGYVFPWTYKEVIPGTGHEEADGSWVWDIPAARIIGNYLQRPVKMETVDMGVRLERYGEELKVGTDYDFVSVEIPNPKIYRGEPHNINEDGSWYALTFHDGTFLYYQDSDLTKVPDYHLEILRNGVWEPYATASWATGSCVITLTDGTVVNGAVVDLPADTENIRNWIVTEKIAAISYDLRVVIRLKPSDTIMAEVNRLFDSSPNPRLDLWNAADLIATRNDVPETDSSWLIVDIKDAPTQKGKPKDGFNEMDGYSTDTQVYPYKEASQKIEDIDFSTNTINIKYNARVEVETFIKEQKTFEQAIADGRLEVPTHGYWYDLLPPGVRYKEGSVTVRSKDKILDTYTKTIEKDGVQRQLLIVEVELQPTAERFKEGDTFYYQDVPSIEFWAEYTLDNMAVYGDYIHNVIAFEADMDKFGTIENYRGEPDDPYSSNNVSTELAFDNDTEKKMMKDLDPNRDTPSFVYAGVYTTIDEVDATRTYLRKDVDVNGEMRYTTGIYHDDPEGNRRDVYEGGNYSYRLLFGNNDETISSNIRIFDNLETFHAAEGNDDIDINKPTWQGYYNGINVQSLIDLGCDPVVYYATQSLPLEVVDPTAATGIKWHPVNTNLQDTSIWTRAEDYTGDLADVKMVAVDASKQPLKEGQTVADDFELQPDQWFAIYISMKAPSGEEARKLIAEDGHAYNNSYMQASSRAFSAQNPEFTEMYVRQDYTKVGMIEHSIKVKKEWNDENNRDGVRPVQVVFHLFANGVDTGKTLTLPIIDEEGNKVWESGFDNIPYADEHGPIRYSVTEEIIDAYTGSLIKEDDSTYKFINTHEPEKISIPGTKTWEGDDETVRPSTLTVILYADGEEIRRMNIKADKDTGEWNYEFKDLYKNREGEEGVPIVYTVKEVVTGLVSSYVPEYVGMNIINRYHPYGDLYLEKELKNYEDIKDNTKLLETPFTFTFEFARIVDGQEEPVYANYDYDILEGDTVVSSGKIGVDYTWDISIKYNQKIHIKEIDQNVRYKVTEANGKGFRLISSTGATGVIPPNGSVSAKFVNEYHASGRINLKAFKMLECGIMQRNQFQFTVYSESNVVKMSTNQDAEVHYNEDGSVSYSVAPVTFSAINYTEKDAGKTYRYRIVESVKADGTDGVTYDTREFYAVVTIDDTQVNGTLDVNVVYLDEDGNEIDEIVFENSYEAEGSKQLVAWKEMKGRQLQDSEFTFELFAQDPDTGEWGFAEAQTNNGEGVITFEELHFDQNDNGKTFYFLVHETKKYDGKDYDTIVFDESWFGYKLTVTDTGKGVLDIVQEMIDPENVEYSEKDGVASVTWKEGEGSMPVFRNGLNPGTLQIIKYIDPESEDYDPDTEFTFHVELFGEDLPEGELPYYITKLDSPFAPVEEPFHPFPFGVSAGGSISGPSALMGTVTDTEDLKRTAAAQREVYHATDEELEGTAYAILDEDGNLIFFRSTETYPNNSRRTVTINDVEYTGTVYTGFEDNNTVSWNKNSVYTVTVADGYAIRPKVITSFFNGMTNLQSADVSRFDTSLVTNLRNTFYSCRSLKELDLSTWDVSNVTDGMGTYEYASTQTANNTRSYVFNGCNSLEKLDVSNWNPNAGFYSGLFSNLPALKELVLENVHLRGAGWATYLFSNLTSLEVLDLSTFYIGHGYRDNLSGIFHGCVFREITLNSSFWFNSGGGNYYTSEDNRLPTPTGEGYSGKWVKKYEDSPSVYPIGFPGVFSANPSGMAGTWIWEGNIFNVSYIGEGTIGSMPDSALSGDKDNTLPANRLVKYGYVFDHWVDEANGYEYEDQGVIPKGRYAQGDHIILTAVFKKIDTNVDVKDGAFDITLKGGEMAIIQGLPAGTSYKVTEIDIPDGWTLVRVENNTGVIESMETVTATFVDKYIPEITTAKLEGMKLLDGRPAEPRSFMFQVTEDGQTEFEFIGPFGDYLKESYPMRAGVINGGYLDFPILVYREPGVHTYRIREMDPNDPNVFMDSHEEVVTVTVTENPNGSLRADIVYDDDGFVFYNRTKPGSLRIYKDGNVDEYNQNDVFTFKITLKDSLGKLFKDGTAIDWFVEERTEEVPAANGEIVDYVDNGTDSKPIVIGTKQDEGNAVRLQADEPVADENTAVLVYHANGGTFTFTGEETDVRYYKSIPRYIFLPNSGDIKRDGYLVTGWNTEADGSGTHYTADKLVTGSAILAFNKVTTLYAEWTESVKVTVNHYKQVDASNYELDDTETFDLLAGDEFTGPVKNSFFLEDESYSYYKTPEAQTITVSEDESQNVINYYYDRNDYTITFDPNGGKGSMDDFRAILGRSNYLPPCTFSKEGAVLLGWSTEKDGSGDRFNDADIIDIKTEPMSTVTLYAQWQDVDEAVVTEGVIYVTCRVGETVVIPNLPAGTQYTVEEVGIPSNWVLKGIMDASGMITSGSVARVSALNEYSYKPAYLDLVAYKRLLGREITEGEFTFELLDHNKKTIQTVENGVIDNEEFLLDEDGNTVLDENGDPVRNPHYGYSIARFDTITYTEENAGYRYTYYVREIEGKDDTIDYDMTEYKVTVEVLKGPEGRVITNVQYYLNDEPAEPVFTNRTVPGDLRITKVTADASTDDTFTFKVELSDEDGNPLKDDFPGLKETADTKERVRVSDGMTFTLKHNEALSIFDLPAGTLYKVSEIDIPAHWSLQSADNAEGSVISGTEVTVTFTNIKEKITYDTEAVLQVNKKVLGGTIVENSEFPDHFIFELRNEFGDLLQSRSTDEFGGPESTVTFDPIVYTQADAGKTFRYYISERQGHDSMINYDKNIYYADVTVTDTGDELIADVSYKRPLSSGDLELEKITFVNEKFGRLRIVKIDGETEEPLEGAIFTIQDKNSKLYLQEDGNLLPAPHDFITDADGNINVRKVPAGTYILHETKAPADYLIGEDVEFTIYDSKVTVNEETVEFITVTNQKMATLKVVKEDEDTQEKLAGALFTIQDVQTQKYVQADGSLKETIYEFRTGEDGSFSVKSIHEGTYTLHETKAPDHYSISGQDVVFTVSGKDILLGEKVIEFITVTNRKFTYFTIEKILDKWEDSSPVTFIFEVTVEYEGSILYHDMESLTYDGTGKKSIELGDFPVGSKVTVKEVYAGGAYEIKEGTADELTITLQKDKASNILSFRNTWNENRKRGYGAKNSFNKNDEGTWVWVSDLEKGGE